MITIDRIHWISPKFINHLHPNSVKEVEASGDWRAVFAETQDVYVVTDGELPVLLAGVKSGTLMSGPPEIWVLVFKNFGKKHLRQMPFIITSLRELYDELVAYVEVDNEPANKFARFFGFEPVVFGDSYNTYRMN